MRLINSTWGIDLELKDNLVQVIVIEDSRILTSVINSFYQQVNGGEGDFVLSQKDKLLPISKRIIFTMEPISIGINDRKIISKLYQEIIREIEEKHLEEKMILNSNLVEFLETIVSRLPYIIEYEINLDILGLLKLQNVKLEEANQALIEKLISYVKILSELCGYKIFIFLNLKMYLTEIELKYLYESAFYSKVNLILIENIDRGIEENEEVYIIDRDGCIITIH